MRVRVCRYKLPKFVMVNYSKNYIHSSKSSFVSSFATASVGAYLMVELFIDLQDGSHVSASVFVRGGCCREWGRIVNAAVRDTRQTEYL